MSDTLQTIEEIKILLFKMRGLFAENNKYHAQLLDETLEKIMKLQEKELEKDGRVFNGGK